MAASDSRPSLRVRDYMTAGPTTLTPEARLLDAVLTIRGSNIRHLPIVSDGKLVGLLSDRDISRFSPSILRASQEEYNELFEQTLVRTVMTKNLTTVGPDTSLAEAVSLLISNKLGCLPVVEGEQLVGILSVTDALRFASDALSGTVKLG